jgi:tetratricopeptide (TPR) repeat protein
MKTHAVFFAVCLVIAGCAGTEVKKEAPVADKAKMIAGYLATAQQQESKGELVEALENYKLALTVDPENPTAQAKRAEIEKKLSGLADENYKAGLELQRMGRYAQARQRFLTAVRYKPDFPEAVEMLKAERLDSQRVRLHFLYVIKPGEQLSHVAERYYRDYQKHYLIGAYNEVDDATKIAAGQTIKIPVIEGLTCFVSPDEAAALSKQRTDPLPPEVIVVKGYATHTVRTGDTLVQLSQRYYGVKDRADLIAKYNNLKETAGFKPGRKLLIPQVPGAPFLGSASAEPPTSEVPKGAPAEVKEPAPKVKPEPATPAPAPAPAAAVDQLGDYRQQGIEFHKSKNYPAAIAEFKKVLNVEPKDPVSLQYISQAHFELGVKSFEQKSYSQAAENFRSSLAYNRSCDKCSEYIRKSEDAFKEEHYSKGLASFQNEKLADAIREWELVHDLDPAYKDVSKNLQKARTLQERLDAITRSKPQ